MFLIHSNKNYLSQWSRKKEILFGSDVMSGNNQRWKRSDCYRDDKSAQSCLCHFVEEFCKNVFSGSVIQEQRSVTK